MAKTERKKAQKSKPAEDVGGTHWMVNVAFRAGVLSGSEYHPDRGLGIPEIWAGLALATDLPQSELAILVADYFRLRVAALEEADPRSVLELSVEAARKYCVFPLEHSERALVVATSDPTNIEAERALGFASGKTVVFQVAPPADILRAIKDRYGAEQSFESTLVEQMGENELIHVMDDEEQGSISVEDIHAAPVVKLTNLILRDGIRQRASDIHIEPGIGSGKVRFRVDGVLRKYMDVPMPAMLRMISQIKVRSDMDIADRLRPQDGRTRVNVDQKIFDLRISTIPAGRAEKCVVRILDQSESQLLDDLQIQPEALVRFRKLLSYRQGILVVTGPTGSGKTTTLYGALREIADGKINIMTVEDPIEYSLPAVTQTQVEVKQGMTFGGALRAILRQDPDVILIGEIRDAETAKIAAQAAMTGHLVLATVHANDAVGVVPRLVDLGLDQSMIAETLRGAVAQRLLRKVCPDCAEEIAGDLTPDEVTLFQRYDVRPRIRAAGCSQCGYSGYRGRIPILEVLTVGPSLEEAISKRKGGATLQALATRGGMSTLECAALRWVEQGATTLVEVERVVGSTKDDFQKEREEKSGPTRILVVDDDAETRLKHRSILEKDGYRVEEAADGEEAVRVLDADSAFSMVLLDLKMPGMDGLEVLRVIRDTVDTYALPVMISTSQDSEESEMELLDAGADDYVEKTARPERFMARVRAVLRRSML